MDLESVYYLFIIALTIVSGHIDNAEGLDTPDIEFTIYDDLDSQDPITRTELRDFLWRFIKLENSYDLGIFELYAPNATIDVTRSYPGGHENTRNISIEFYKSICQVLFPIQQIIGREKNIYSNVSAKVYGNVAIIDMKRYNTQKERTYAHRIVVEKHEGKLTIVLESGESSTL